MTDLKTVIENNIVRVPEAGCWIWMRSTRGQRAYGQFTHSDRSQEGAHVVAYRAYVGKIPGKMQVCHICDVPCCVNPAHLFLGTAKDNAQDCVRKGRLRPGRAGGQRKVAIKQHGEILKMYKGGMLQRQIAELFGITQVRVSQILRRHGT